MWAVDQRHDKPAGKKKTADHEPDLDEDLDLGVDDDPIDDDDEPAGKKNTVRSYEERRDAVREAARSALARPRNADGSPEWWVYVVETWEDRVVVNRSRAVMASPRPGRFRTRSAVMGRSASGEITRVELVAQLVPSTNSAEFAAGTVDAIVRIIEDAGAILSMAFNADMVGLKGAWAGTKDAVRLSAAAVQLFDALEDAGVDIDGLAVTEEPEVTKPDEKQAETADEGPANEVVLDMADIQATLTRLREA